MIIRGENGPPRSMQAMPSWWRSGHMELAGAYLVICANALAFFYFYVLIGVSSLAVKALILSVIGVMSLPIAAVYVMLKRDSRASSHALAETEQQITEAIDCFSDAFALFDPEGRLIRSNNKFRRILEGMGTEVRRELFFDDLLSWLLAEAELTGVLPDLMRNVPDAWLSECAGRFRSDAEAWRAWHTEGYETGELYFDVRIPGEVWLRISETRTPDGNRVFVAANITKYKTIERDLERSRENYAMAIEATDSVHWSWSADTNLVTVPNGLNNHPDDRDLQRTFNLEEWAALVHPEDRPRQSQTLVDFFVGKSERLCNEYRMRHEDGTYHWYRTLATGSRDGKGEMVRIAGSITDITDAKRAEFALRKSEEDNALAIDAMHGLAWEWDAATHTLETKPGRLLHSELEEFHADGSGDSFRERVHPDDRERYMVAFKDHLRGKTPLYECEYRMRSLNGDYHWVHDRGIGVRDKTGRVLRVVGAVVDVNDRRLAEEALVSSRSEFELAVEATDGILWSWDVASRRAGMPKDGLEKLGIDWSNDTISWDDWLSLIHPEDVSPYFEVLADYARSNRRIMVQEYRVRTKSGAYIWLHDRSIALRDTQGHMITIIGSIVNITERKTTEAKLTRAKEEAEKANEAKSRFLASMSHELRTPLNAIIGYADLIVDDGTAARAVTDLTGAREALSGISNDARYISESARQLLGLINSILDQAKADAHQITLSVEEFSVQALVQDLIVMFEPLAAQNGNRLEVLGQTDGSMTGDRMKIRQCLINLLGNACKFTTDGHIELSIGKGPSDGPEMVAFRVSDTGIGIDPKFRDKLFQPFTQADETLGRQFEGTGLGLSITQSLARLMDGDVSVVSTPGLGSVFTLCVPRFLMGASPQTDTSDRHVA